MVNLFIKFINLFINIFINFRSMYVAGSVNDFFRTFIWNKFYRDVYVEIDVFADVSKGNEDMLFPQVLLNIHKF